MIKFAKISIEPYIDPEVTNIGLEKYNMSTFPDTELTEYLGQDTNGRYLTGIDENSPNILYIENTEEKEAKIKEIKEIVERLEKVFGSNKLQAQNDDFWSSFALTVSNRKDLDLKNPKDELIFHCIRAGGFQEIAPDYETAKTSPIIYKFYLKKEEEEENAKIQLTIKKNKAKGILNTLYEESPDIMFRISKVVLSSANNFKPKTPVSLIYSKLNDFIDGVTVKTNKRETANEFIKASQLDKETLSITGYVNDAVYYGILKQEKDNHFYNMETQNRLGKNQNEIIAFLKNPINSSELENIIKRIETKWNN